MLESIRKFLKKQQGTCGVKYFCIGRNKTGTTSLEKAFKDLGFIVGNQYDAEALYDKSFDFLQVDDILAYCNSAQVFQDLPFSMFDIVPYLDIAFPNAKFILTIRDSPEEWYNSLVKFHGKLFSATGDIPTVEELQNAEYVSKGFVYRAMLAMGVQTDDPYNKELLIKHYLEHNQKVIEYFNNRPSKLLVINLSESGSYSKFIKFINVPSDETIFPHENKTLL